MDAQRLRAATGCSFEAAEKFAPQIESACVRWGIDTPMQRAAFVAQVAHETMLFTRFEENLNYTSAQRLIQVFSVFGLPDAEHEIDSDVLDDGKLNAYRFLRSPEKLANAVYANRMGNGGPETGDGWRYRGRGGIQVTGKANYRAYSDASGVDAIHNPDALIEPSIAMDSAAWYWDSIQGNDLLEQGGFGVLTKRINAASLDIAKRSALFSAAMVALV